MAETKIRIASYNIRKARGLDQRRDPARILQVVNQLGADIVVLQEADKRLGERPPALPRQMIEAETDFRVIDVARNGVSLGFHGNAVLAKRDFDVRDVTRVDLPGLEPRGAVQLDFEIAEGLSVVATHLGLRRKDRLAQLAELDKQTRSRRHCVIAGDFNEWSPHKGLDPLADRFVTHAPGRSFHARRPLAALDRFALSHELALYDGGVEEGALAKRASDHLPIWSDVIVPEAARSTC